MRAKKRKALKMLDFKAFLNGGGCEIRTHAPVKANGFQDRLVMTTSITLRVEILSCKYTDRHSNGFGGPCQSRKHSRPIRQSRALPSLLLVFGLRLKKQHTVLFFLRSHYDRFDMPPSRSLELWIKNKSIITQSGGFVKR